jgi:serine/threonine-protein kinase RsbT
MPEMEKQIPINVESDVLVARQAGRDMAKQLGFGSADQTRLATAISELGRNVINYAKEGLCTIIDESDQSMIRLKVIVEDHGPGIPDIQKALTDGFTTGRSLGVGLPGTKRLVHEFDIVSRPGHTKVTCGIVRQKTAGASSGAGRRGLGASSRQSSPRQRGRW